MALSLEVFFSPVLFPYSTFDPNRNIVVIDIYRATTAICAAFMAGAERIIPVSDLKIAEKMRSDSLLLAAEREGKKLPFADYGNSAHGFFSMNLKGKSLIYSTTNGTVAMEKAQTAGKVVLGGFCNLQALTKYLVQQECNTSLLCSGWKNAFSMEDSLFAGALAQSLIRAGHFQTQDDSCVAAMALYDSAKDDLSAYLRQASHYKRLEALNMLDDLGFCLQTDTCPIVPVMAGGEVVVKS
ncbi:MAG: 2-phosphosulfolactate phosphatase [Bacteroidales bacterium]|nr:2-phosphosulfolactate phosphatase [Bacteroidales bacterium]